MNVTSDNAAFSSMSTRRLRNSSMMALVMASVRVAGLLSGALIGGTSCFNSSRVNRLTAKSRLVADPNARPCPRAGFDVE